MYAGFFCDILSLLIITCLQRNIPWMSWTKKLMRNLVHSNVIWFLIWRKKLWMKLRLYWVKKTNKLKFWSHKLLYCRIMSVQWGMPSIRKRMYWSSIEESVEYQVNNKYEEVFWKLINMKKKDRSWNPWISFLIELIAVV